MARAPLSELEDWQLEHDNQNIYGWRVTDGGGGNHGNVFELIVDTEQERVVEIVTDTGERFDPHDVDILDGFVTLHDDLRTRLASSGATPVISTSDGQPETVSHPAPDWTTDQLINRSQVHITQPPLGERLSPGVPDEPVVGASMASAAPETESGPPTMMGDAYAIRTGSVSTGATSSGATSDGEWTTISSTPEQRSPRIRRVGPGERLESSRERADLPQQQTSPPAGDQLEGERPPIHQQLESGRQPIDHQLPDAQVPPDHLLKP